MGAMGGSGAMGAGRMSGMMSGGMMGGMAMGRMGGGFMGTSTAAAKKDLKTLTRTDFLLQFAWKPPKPEDLPKTEDDEKNKIKDFVDKMKEAEKNNPAVTMPKVEEIQAASLKKSEEIDSQIQKALTPVGAPGTPGFAAPPAGAGTPGAPAGAVPNQGGAVRPPGQ
jgi:type IV pilus assembly protein PilM